MDLSRPILSFKHATAFLTALSASGKLFPLETDPEAVTEPTGPVFNAQQVHLLRQRVQDLERINWMPHGFKNAAEYAKTLKSSKLMSPKLKALLDFLKAMGANVREFQDHAMISFNRDCPYTDFLRDTIFRFKRENKRCDWYSENPYSGEITWS